MEKLSFLIQNNELNELNKLLSQHNSLINEPIVKIKVQWTLLHLAASLGHTEAVNLLITHGANPQKTDAYGWLPAHIAVLNGHLQCLERLLINGTSVGALTNSHQSLLFLAVDANRLSIIDYLIKKFANPFELTNYGMNSLEKAVSRGFLSVLKILLKSKCCKTDLNHESLKQLFVLALNHNQIHIADYLVSKYSNLFNYSDINRLNFKSKTIHLYLTLLDALQTDSAVFIKTLDKIIENGYFSLLFVSLRIVIKKNLSGLVSSYKDKILTCIYSLKTTKQIINYCFENYPQEASLLITHFKNINFENIDNSGQPISWLVIEKDDVQLLKSVLNTFDQFSLLSNSSSKDNILHYAVQSGAINCLQYLVNKYQELLFQVNKQGESVLHIAVKFGQLESIQYLLTKTSIPVDSQDNQSITPLYVAVSNNQIDCVKLLISAGANVLAQNKLGKSSLDIAKESNNQTLIQLLTSTKIVNVSNEKKQIKPDSIRLAVFQGGGVKGAGFLGALEVLVQRKQLNFEDLEIVAGTSAGAITAFLIAIGYSLNELSSIIKKMNFFDLLEANLRKEFFDLKSQLSQHNGIEKFLGPNIYKLFNRVKNNKINKQYLTSIFTNYITSKLPLGLFQAITHHLGIHDGDLKKLESEFEDLKIRLNPFLAHFQSNRKGLFAGEVLRRQFVQWLKDKKLDETLSFRELYRKSLEDRKYKSLYVAAYDANERRTIIFSHETTPDVIIADAVRSSMSIQLFFEPHKYYIKQYDRRILDVNKADHLLYDGGSLDNYLLGYFDKLRYTQSITEFDIIHNAENKITNSYAVGFRLATPELFNYYENGAETPSYSSEGTKDFILSIIHSLLTFSKQESDYMLSPDEQARTVNINTLDIDTVEFDITPERTEKLIQSGRDSAELFLRRYNKKPVDQTVELLKKLLPHGQNTEKTDQFILPINSDERFNAFYKIAENLDKGNFSQALTILKINIDTIKNNLGDTLFHQAVKIGNIAVLTKLLEQYPDRLSIKNFEGLFPADCIIYCKDSLIREQTLILLNKNKALYSKFITDSESNFTSDAQKTQYLLWYASSLQKFKGKDKLLYPTEQQVKVLFFLKALAAANTTIDTKEHSLNDLFNYVHILVKNGCIDLIKKLGLSIDQTNENSMTLLHYFVLTNDKHNTACCLDNYIFKHAINKNGETPLDLALKIISYSEDDTKLQQREMIIFLIKRSIFRCSSTTKNQINMLLNFKMFDPELDKGFVAFNAYDQTSSLELEIREFDEFKNYNNKISDARNHVNVERFSTSIFPPKKQIATKVKQSSLIHKELIFEGVNEKLNNEATKLFLGNGNTNTSHLEFDTWYHPEICHYLLQMIDNNAKCLRVVFPDAGYGDNTHIFKNQLLTLIAFAKSFDKPAIFISKEPGAENHFICGLIKGNELLLINPLGITDKDICYQTLSELKAEDKLNKIWLSNNILQQRLYEERLVSCGAISIEIAIHILKNISSEMLEDFWCNLKTKESPHAIRSDLIYHDVDIKALLPASLSLLEKSTDSANYKQKLINIREEHYHKLQTLPISKAELAQTSVDNYLKSCLLQSAPQVIFNMLFMGERTLLNIYEVLEYALLTNDLGTSNVESVHKTVSTTSNTTIAKNSAQLFPSIFDLEQNAKRDKLHDEEMVKQKLAQRIPLGFELGVAIGQGDCFFDALAQGLNKLMGKEEFVAKSLRLVCDEYVKNLINTDWVKAAITKNGGNYDQYLTRIQFTANEIENMKQQGGVDLGQAEWGNPHIEGRIICAVLRARYNLNVNLHVIEVHEQAIDGVEVLEQQVDSINAKSIDPLVVEGYESANIIHLVNYKNHFVPLLDSKKNQTEKLLTQFAEHSPNVQVHNQKNNDQNKPSLNNLEEDLNSSAINSLANCSNYPSSLIPPPPPLPSPKTHQLLKFMNDKNKAKLIQNEKKPEDLLKEIKGFSKINLRKVNIFEVEQSWQSMKNKPSQSISNVPKTMADILVSAMGNRRSGMCLDEEDNYQPNQYLADEEWKDQEYTLILK